MKKAVITYSIATAIALGLTGLANADICEQGQEHYTNLKSEYENCIRTKAGKFKHENPACIQIKEKMTAAQSDIKDCRMAKAVNRALAANNQQDSVRAKYKWQSEK